MIRVIILDKLLLARKRLTTLLSKERDISIVYANDGAVDLGEVIRNERPALVFLDIDLLDTSRLSTVAFLSSSDRPYFVFVTPYEHFAVHAFAAGATDYLLKPLTAARVQMCLKKVRRGMNTEVLVPGLVRPGSQGDQSRVAPESSVKRRIAIRSGKKRILVTLDSIEWCEAAGNYVIFHVGREKHMVRGAIGDLPAMLGTQRFLRISKSIVVNVEQVAFVEQIGAGDIEVGLSNGTTHVVSRLFRKNLEDNLAAMGACPRYE